MPDAGAKNTSSPWDEPLDEVAKSETKKPTVVGDLDFNKSTVNKEEKTVQAFNVPASVEEKVGAKVEATQIVSGPDEQEIKIEDKNTSTVKVTDTSKAPSGDDFWKSVYSRSSSNPQPAAPVASAPASSPVAVNNLNQNQTNLPPKMAVSDISKTEAVAQPIYPQKESQPTNLYQPIPADTTNKISATKQIAPVAPNPAKKLSFPVFKMNKIKTIIVAAVVGILVLFTGGVYLTEAGIISVGLEKFYGLVHLEAIWGGLPANPENALALSAIEMKGKDSYRVSGEATITINRGVKSDMISPIVAVSTLPIIAFDDQDLGQSIKTVLAAYEDDLLQDESGTESNSSSTTTNNSNQTLDQPSPSSASSQKPTIEEFKVDLNAGFDKKVSGAEINLKSTSKTSSSIDLVYSSGKIYLKSSKDIIYDPNVPGGWLSYDLKKFKDPNPSEQFWSSNLSGSDFSVIGKRTSSETIGDVRCFHYSATVNIGGAFDSFGLPDSSLSSLELEYWIGVKDHLIRQINIKAVPTSKSAISRIDMMVRFSEYDSGDSGFIVPASSTPSTLGNSSVSSQLSPGGSSDQLTDVVRDQKRKSDLANIAKALENYKSTRNAYPISTGEEKVSSSSGSLYVSLVSGYITYIPLDPLDPTYYYGYESDGKNYTLSAVLESGSDAEGRKIGDKNIYFLRNQ